MSHMSASQVPAALLVLATRIEVGMTDAEEARYTGQSRGTVAK